ncbi:MAG: glutamate--tRNA ligase family protein [Phycisphaerales bacterium]
MAHGPDRPPTTRIAPSPTGALHLGNLRTFLINWAMARREGWKIVLRIEDLDGPRVKPGSIEQCIDLLSWVGIDWDEGPLIQSEDLGPYERAMTALARAGVVYPCELTRSEIEAAASAPQEGSGELRYPPELRPELKPRDFDDGGTNWRFVASDAPVRFIDRFAGEQERNVAQSVGDFVVWTKRGQPSYQLAVTVDDAAQGVTHIVRGDDLLDSVARQLLLYRALELPGPVEWVHLPLVIGEDGKRLAKRHGDTRTATYRERGVDPDRLVGLIAYWSGASDQRQPMAPSEFVERFELSRMTADPVVFTQEDDAWLLDESRRS